MLDGCGQTSTPEYVLVRGHIGWTFDFRDFVKETESKSKNVLLSNIFIEIEKLKFNILIYC
jgi:hypothetical protein